MSFKTTLVKAIRASESVTVGDGVRMLSLLGLWCDPRAEEATTMGFAYGEVMVHDQAIEVDDNGCSVFEDVEGIKRAIQLSVMRALTVEDMAPEREQQEEATDAAG